MPPPSKASVRRLASYRPVLDGLIFGLALLGVLTSIHLGIQQERGFDQGCFGFSASQQVEDTFDCEVVTESEASNLLGVSNSTWGLLFYIFVAAITFLVATNAGGRLQQLKGARAVLIALGFLYSMYLVYYQFFGIGELCALCLTSAGITTLLFIGQAVDFAKTGPPSSTDSASRMDSPLPKRRLAYMGAAVVLLVFLIGADYAYFNSIDSPEPALASDLERPAREASSSETAAPTAVAVGECSYDPEKPLVNNYAELVNFFDPTAGTPDADVTVIEFFDPNCPHCATIHPIMMNVVRDRHEQALFVFKPFVLWNHSIAQSEALYAAAQEGKFFLMLEQQYAIQQPRTGLGEPELRQIAENIGMDPDALMQRIESGLYRRTLSEQRQKAIDAGVNSTPAVMINGRFVDGDSKSTDCLKALIDAATRS